MLRADLIKQKEKIMDTKTIIVTLVCAVLGSSALFQDCKWSSYTTEWLCADC